MKSLMMALVFVATSFTLQAQARSLEPVPQEALIQLRMGGGMPVPGGLMSREITVTTVGQVIVKEATYGTDFDDIHGGRQEREYILGWADAADLAMIKATVAELRGGEFLEPDGPQCMDAPSYSYSVVKDSNSIPVYRIFGCQDLELEDQSQRKAARDIKEYLDQWLALSRG